MESARPRSGGFFVDLKLDLCPAKKRLTRLPCKLLGIEWVFYEGVIEGAYHYGVFAFPGESRKLGLSN